MEQTLLDWLMRHYPNAKKQTFKRMLQEGRISVDGQKPIRLKHPLRTASVVQVARGEKGTSAGGKAGDGGRDGARSGRAPAAGPRLDIVYEDGDLLVVNKPAGLLTSTVADEKRATLAEAVRQYLQSSDPQARCGVIHRLDRDASGLLVFAKNLLAFKSLKEQFSAHSVERIYIAVVYGLPNPPAGRIENRLLELPDGRVVSTRHHGKGQQAITEYETLRTHGKVSMVRVKLLTGRKHQIRSHLSERRTPIVGDTMYPVAPLAAAEDVWETVGGENGGRGRGKDEKTGPEEPGKNNSSENPSPLHSDRSTGVRGKPGSYCGAPASRTQGQRSRAARDAGVRKPDPVGHGRLLLAATRLGLDQPRTGRRLAFEIKLPPEFRQAITGQEQ